MMNYFFGPGSTWQRGAVLFLVIVPLVAVALRPIVVAGLKAICE